MKAPLSIPDSGFRIPEKIQKFGIRNQKWAIQRGFTLVELLVAVAVLSILMVLLFSFFDQATKAWQNSEKKVDAFREVRAALYYLKRDLEGLYTDSNIPFYYFDDPGSINPIGYSGADRPPAANGDCVFFLSVQSQDAQDSSKARSDLCAVGYYLAYWQDTNSLNRASYKLHRYFKSSDDTWTHSSDSEGIYPYLASVQTGSPNPGILFMTAQASASLTADEVIAHDVINFEVKPLKDDYTALDNAGATTGPFTEKPAFFQISLTALNESTAAKLGTQADWHDSSSILYKQNAQIFHLRVAIPK